MNAPVEYIPVWKQVTQALREELVDFWMRHNAIASGRLTSAARAMQAVCIARAPGGPIVGVGTAVLRVPQRLRQPMYYYRQFFAPEFRGRGQAIPFYRHARGILQDHNAALPSPESLGILVEVENTMLATHYRHAYVEAADSTFIGYSPRGLQLRVSYFEGARLMPAHRAQAIQAALPA